MGIFTEIMRENREESSGDCATNDNRKGKGCTNAITNQRRSNF